MERINKKLEWIRELGTYSNKRFNLNTNNLQTYTHIFLYNQLNNAADIPSTSPLIPLHASNIQRGNIQM